MMYFFPSSFLFLFFMVAGVFISMSSSSLFLVWSGLEMNLMGFIPLMIQMKNLGEIEAAVKYFLIQSFGSALILVGVSFTVFKMISASMIPASSPVWLGLAIKLGVFPFYFWLPSVMVKLDWVSCTLISTWQKVAPFGIIMTLGMTSSSIMVMLGVGSSLVGGLMGMNQVNIKSILAYSSVGHMGWMLSISQFSCSVCMIYLGLYLITNLVVFIILMKMNFYWMKSLKTMSSLSGFSGVLMGMSFLTLGGIPPLLGFFPKLLGIDVLVNSGFYLSSLMLVLGTCFSLYYYISMILNSCMNSYYWNWSKFVLPQKNGFTLNLSLNLLILINIFGITMFLLLI